MCLAFWCFNELLLNKFFDISGKNVPDKNDPSEVENMEKRLSLTVDNAPVAQTESDTMSELLEHQKQKIRKLTEQRADEIEKYNTAQREYYELVQKSDRALRPRIQAAFEKQKDNHNKRISHLTKKVENYRAKVGWGRQTYFVLKF